MPLLCEALEVEVLEAKVLEAGAMIGKRNLSRNLGS